MIKIILLLFSLVTLSFTSFCLAAESLEQRFAQAKDGDFIVTAQESNYSLLFVRSITADTLLLEEISIPDHQVDVKKIDWQNWVMKKAPGHTSWTLYEIDRKSAALIECFSFSKNGWLYLDESEQFLTRLLSLQLSSVSEKERKRIGPPPSDGEQDVRGLWNPPLIVNQKKVAKPIFDVFKARWPEDSTRLSRCSLELYFRKDEPSFPFPYWIEVQSPHYSFKMRTVDSGHNLISSMPGAMPHRSPKILGIAQKENGKWILPIQTPPYFQKLHLFVIDLSAETKVTIPLPSQIEKNANTRQQTLVVEAADINQLLKLKHRYRWVLIPEGGSDIYVESEEIFTYTDSGK
jgi:hypothetical protein